MISTLGLSLIAELMQWDTDEATAEYGWLQLMSSVKYDGYADFRAGSRFFESLATWLRQFSQNDRRTAYAFVRHRLVYISAEEMQRVIEIFIPETVTPHLRKVAAAEAGIKPYEVWGRKEGGRFYQRVWGLADRLISAPQRRTEATTGRSWSARMSAGRPMAGYASPQAASLR